VDVTSLGFQTDLALLRLGGSEVEDHGTYLVVRSPHNPAFWWGNFILLSGPPPPDEAPRWLDIFARELPQAKHVALGFDSVDGTVEDLGGFVALGLKPAAATVMTAREVHPPARPNERATYRPLGGDDDWAQQVGLRVACNDDDDPDADADLDFATAYTNTTRALTEAGHGVWFGAFDDGRLLASMGLFTTAQGNARFQLVQTHPEFRGQGLAGTLVHYVSRYGFDKLGARTLVMVADPDYSAIRIYRSVGFAATESQLGAERAPRSDG
jgi:GNAT superfamily N-acetyltransferase